jgi:hypothetical protein
MSYTASIAKLTVYSSGGKAKSFHLKRGQREEGTRILIFNPPGEESKAAIAMYSIGLNPIEQ